MKKLLLSLALLGSTAVTSLAIAQTILLPTPFTGASYKSYVDYVYGRNKKQFDAQEKQFIDIVYSQILRVRPQDASRIQKQDLEVLSHYVLCGQKLFCYVVAKNKHLKDVINKEYESLAKDYPLQEFYTQNLKDLFSLDYYKILVTLFGYRYEDYDFMRMLQFMIKTHAELRLDH